MKYFFKKIGIEISLTYCDQGIDSRVHLLSIYKTTHSRSERTNLCLTNRSVSQPVPQAFIHFNGVCFTLKFSLEDVNYWCFIALQVFYSEPL